VPNLYEATLASGMEVNSSGPQFALTQDAEAGMFGLPNFTKFPVSWDEAVDRFPYVAMNWASLDMGNPIFGDVSLVFNHSDVKRQVLIAALDTGLWEGLCHAPELGALPKFQIPALNCSVPLPAVGSLDYFEHVLLANIGFWSNQSSVVEEAAWLLQRGPLGGPYSNLPEITGIQTVRYLESDILGNVRVNPGVKFVIGHFMGLFGSPLGLELQQWCLESGRLLVWALGADVLSMSDPRIANMSFALNQRTLDPVVAQEQANATQTDVAQWLSLWDEAKETRGQDNTPLSPQQAKKLWDQLTKTQTTLAPLTAQSCAEFDRCVGVSVKSGDCVCYTS